MKLLISKLPLMLAALMLAACSSAPQKTSMNHELSPMVSESSESQRLLSHYQKWRGTPYRYGGQSKQGIDCSGFIQLTYRDIYHQRVPRTTRLLSSSGHQVPESSRQVGDLLLFKTGSKQRHVGIYVGNAQFIHASTSRGVTLSSLDNPYWADAYRQTRRIKP